MVSSGGRRPGIGRRQLPDGADAARVVEDARLAPGVPGRRATTSQVGLCPRGDTVHGHTLAIGPSARVLAFRVTVTLVVAPSQPGTGVAPRGRSTAACRESAP